MNYSTSLLVRVDILCFRILCVPRSLISLRSNLLGFFSSQCYRWATILYQREALTTFPSCYLPKMQFYPLVWMLDVFFLLLLFICIRSLQALFMVGALSAAQHVLVIVRTFPYIAYYYL